MTQKRIAVQLFGHLRTFEKTFESFKKHILEANEQDGYKIDIFIHTWDELDHSTVNYRNPNGQSLTDKTLTDFDIDMAKRLYTPKAFKITDQKDCEELILIEKIGKFKRSIKGCLNMSFTLFTGNKLRESFEKYNNVNYDWVIVTRPDIFFRKDFRVKDIFALHEQCNLKEPKNSIFYAFNPFGRENMVEEPQFVTGSDLIFMAKPEDISKATSLFEDFNNNIDKDNFYCMENWWYNFWLKKGLNIYPINFKHGLDFDVIKSKADIEMVERENKPKSEKKKKQFSRKIRKFLLSLLPYLIVKSSIKKLNKRIKRDKY